MIITCDFVRLKFLDRPDRATEKHCLKSMWPGRRQSAPPASTRFRLLLIRKYNVAGPATYFLGSTSVRPVTVKSHYVAPPPKRCVEKRCRATDVQFSLWKCAVLSRPIKNMEIARILSTGVMGTTDTVDKLE
eukprot:g17222.t1